MNVISFFSYKGGVGRTTLLANVAAHIASTGKRLACIDLDINAPGLDIVFDVMGEPLRGSIVDFLLSHRALLAEEMCVKIEGAQRWGTNGTVFLFPYPRGGRPKVAQFSNAMNKFLHVFLETVDEQLEVDYILIDTRSGFSREAAPVWMESNQVCLVTRCSYQHLEGTQGMLETFKNINASRPSHIIEPIVVFNDVPADLPNDRNQHIESKCKDLNAIKIMENRELRWRDRVIVFDDQFNDTTTRGQHISFVNGCEQIAERLLLI